MSHGARAILEQFGCTSVAELATFHPDGARARGNLDASIVPLVRDVLIGALPRDRS